MLPCTVTRDALQEQHLAELIDSTTSALQDAEEQLDSQEPTPGPERPEGRKPSGKAAALTLDTSPEVRPHSVQP